jgi:hypothetical protein
MRVRVVILSTLLTACVAYFNDIRIDPPAGAPPRLTEPQIVDAVQAIGAALADLGMVESPNLAYLMKSSTESREYPNLVVGFFEGRPEADAFEGREIAVYCHVGKKDGEFSVRIRDLAWPTETEVTRVIQERVREVLRKQFPGASFPEKPWRSLRLLSP